MHRIFTDLYYCISRRRPLCLAVAGVLMLGCLLLIGKIRFDEDISQIIPKSDKADITAKVLRQQNFSDKIVVIIEKSPSAGDYALSETADEFLSRLQPLQKKFIKNIQGKVDEGEVSRTFNFVNENLPLFLDAADYAKIEGKLRADSIRSAVADNFAAMLSPAGVVTKDFVKRDPLGITYIGLKKLGQLGMGAGFHLEDGYVLSKDGRSLLLFIEPKFGGSETRNNEKFVAGLEDIRAGLNRKFSGQTSISYFGSPVIAVANARQIKSDIQKTVLISTALLLVLLIFYFRNFFTPFIIFIPTAFSAVLALAFMYLIKDRISAVSLSIGAILLGITIDYALHILTHYKHKANIEEVYREITHPVIMSAATTAVSFLCLVFVRSEALKDLGIFAAVTVMLSAIFSLIIIPHIYKPQNRAGQPANTVVDRIGAYPYERNRYLVAVCAAVIVLCFFGFNKIKFNNNIADLNFVPEEMRQSEAKLEKISDIASKSVYAISYGKNTDEALGRNAALTEKLTEQKKSGKILSYSGLGDIILPRKIQEERIRRWNSFWTPERKSLVLNELKSAGAKEGFNESAFTGFGEMISKSYHTLGISDYAKLPALQTKEFLSEKNGLATATTLVKLNEKDRDAFLKSLENQNGVLAIDRQQMNENFLGLLKDDFNSLVNYSLIAVIVIFLLFFRNIDLTVFATIPIVLSGVVTAGILYFLGLELNIFSTIVCTLIFGAGVDFNIFLTQALQKELTTGKSELPTYRVSIILALLTTVLAIGALIFAKHPALHSVAAVALVGMLAVVIISFALYPLLFGFVMKRAAKGLAPVSIRVLLNSAVSLIYYALGGFVFSVLGHLFIKKAKGRSLENSKKSVAKFLASVLYTNPFVKKRIIRNPDEDFTKPAVIIANHSSFLDTLALALATHRIIYLVNDWVYNSPIFGRLVKALGFYPVSQGIENGIDVLHEKVRQGYSLVVFPEAERSVSNQIKRFHKGAFYLAEKYGLDILPIYIHGTSEVMPKGDFMIHDGAITVKVGGRISKDDLSFGKNYPERTKKIQAHFRKNFNELRNDLETADYWKPALYNSLLYKENEVAKIIKKEFQKYKADHLLLDKILPHDAKILHLCGDLGQTDVLLALSRTSRKITSYIQDEDRRAIARQNYVAHRRNIHYPDAIPSGDFDVLIISDAQFLHRINEFNITETVLFKLAETTEVSGWNAVFQEGQIRVFKLENLK